MWDLKIDTRRLVEGFSTSVPWDRPNVLWNKADDWWNDNYVTDSNTAAFLSATGIIDPNKQNYINNLVIALKNQGIWNKAKAIYPFVSEQRNLLNYTEDFSNSYWQATSGALKTPNYAAAPNGTNTACRVYGGGFIQTTNAAKEIATYVFSFYVKMTAGGTGTLRVFLDGGVTTTVVNVTAAWTRVQVSQTFATVDSGTVGFFVDSDVLIWGPQFELGSTATDYQVTINAQEQFAAAYKYNLKDPQDTDAAFRLKIFGSWTFTPTGAKPNGTNAYMDTFYNSSIDGNLNDGFIGTYLRTNSAGTPHCDFGNYNGSDSAITIYARYLNSQLGRWNDVNDTALSTTDSRGWRFLNRNSATTKNNGINATVANTVAAAVSTINAKIYLSALSTNNSPSQYSDRQCAFACLGNGLTDTETATLYTIVQQFQTSMARQV